MLSVKLFFMRKCVVSHECDCDGTLRLTPTSNFYFCDLRLKSIIFKLQKISFFTLLVWLLSFNFTRQSKSSSIGMNSTIRPCQCQAAEHLLCQAPLFCSLHSSSTNLSTLKYQRGLLKYLLELPQSSRNNPLGEPSSSCINQSSTLPISPSSLSYPFSLPTFTSPGSCD